MKKAKLEQFPPKILDLSIPLNISDEININIDELNIDEYELFTLCKKNHQNFTYETLEKIFSEFPDKAHFIIELFSTASEERDIELSYFLMQVLCYYFQKGKISKEMLTEISLKLQEPNDTILTNKDLLFFNHESININLANLIGIILGKENSFTTTLENIRNFIRNILKQDTHEQAMMILMSSANYLIKNDPLLYEYKLQLSRSINPDKQLFKWIKSNKIDDLLDTDINDEVIGPDDKHLFLKEGEKFSGLDLTLTYLLNIGKHLKNIILSGWNTDVLQVSYLDPRGAKQILVLPKTSYNNDIENKFLSLFESPMPFYMKVCIEEVLKPLSHLVKEFNQPTDRLIYGWEEWIERKLDECNTKKDVLNYIYKCTQRGSSNQSVGGLGHYDSEQTNTTMLQKTFAFFWIRILNEQERKQLISNFDFRVFFHTITVDGVLFSDKDKKPYYNDYVGYYRMKAQCLDNAQRRLGITLKNLTGFRDQKSCKSWGYKPNLSGLTELEKPPQLLYKVHSFVCMLTNSRLKQALQFDCKVTLKKNVYTFKSLQQLIMEDNIAQVKELLQNNAVVTNALLKSLDSEPVSSKMLKLLVQKNNYWISKYKTMPNLIENYIRTGEEPPILVVRYFCKEFFGSKKIDEVRYQDFIKNYPISEESIFNRKNLKPLFTSEKNQSIVNKFSSFFGLNTKDVKKQEISNAYYPHLNKF